MSSSVNSAPTISQEALFNHVKQIAGIGRRWLGTPQEAEAVAYIEGQFKAAGFSEVGRQSFSYLNYQPGSCALEVVAPVQMSLPCKPLEYTANGAVEGAVLSVGEGKEEDFKRLEDLGHDFSGKVAMARSFGPWYITARCDERHTAGIVVVTDPPDGMIRNLTARLYPPPLEAPYERHQTSFPGVNVSLDTGDLLSSLLSTGGLRLRVSHQATYSTRQTTNLFVEVSGREKPDELVVVGAHYDTQMSEGPFAWDNATGIAALLEMARAVRERPARRTMRFIAFSAEEIGLWGASAYADANASELRDRCVGMVDLDALSTIYPSQRTVWHANGIDEFATEVAEGVGWKVDTHVDAREFLFSDYVPFMELGIPSVWVFEFPPGTPYYHTEKDVLEVIDPKKLYDTAYVNHAIAWELASRDELPFRE